jgi:two-component system sensor histidine kinase/response regulator
MLPELSQLQDAPVLIVDDNATNRNILMEIFRQWHWRPTAVASAQAALEALVNAQNRQEPFALTLIDAQMPEMDGFALVEHLTGEALPTGAMVMMLTSAVQQGDAARGRPSGVVACVTKPITQSDLVAAINTTCLSPAKPDERRSPPVSPTPGADQPILRILLAEDNAVNQTLAVRLLERRGHAVVVAKTGKEALTAWKRQTFDLILMDVQMPEMDGFETTAAIRAAERSTGGHTPIIAMTAHAMAGHRQRCLEAGMDGYVPKPIQAQTVFDVIERVCPTSPSA